MILSCLNNDNGTPLDSLNNTRLDKRFVKNSIEIISSINLNFDNGVSGCYSDLLRKTGMN